ncbi:hypothetical protein COT72_01170 [archaeon CG10_big_fil_rev_8_21_14_0_10_43_11]|nr:MAG: hypothetical protein COT72_01170 [archaeon CG10_big_fil_rev_8_21_14_0_10_43_11]
MEFRQEGFETPNLEYYHAQNLAIAREFAKKLHQEFGEFLQVAVLFGSTTKETMGAESDVDILTVIDDVRMNLSQELLDAYQIITEKIIVEVSNRLHVHTIALTSFWEFTRNGDPVIINILRDGVALIDHGFFNPMQRMLFQGRIRPSGESIHNYASMAPKALFNANLKMLQAVIDLYWGAIDITHAYLMKQGEIPLSPEHVVKPMSKYKAFKKEDRELVAYLYELTKNILYRKKNVISGKEFDMLKKRTEDYYERIKKELGIY